MGRQARFPAKHRRKTRMIDYIILAFVAVHFFVSFAVWTVMAVLARAIYGNR
jgi:nitrate/nitrite transporter NarK